MRWRRRRLRLRLPLGLRPAPGLRFLFDRGSLA